LRRGIAVLAVVYLTAIFVDGAHQSWPAFVPRSALFFVQCSCLFPVAAEMTIDYRIEALHCDGSASEINPGDIFPVHPDDKENLYSRAMHFFHGNKAVLGALDDFIAAHAVEHIAGVRFLSLRIPIPPQGAPDVAPYTRDPIASVPASERKVWYTTPTSTRESRCAP
jgi:hypothetical protein